LKWTCDEPQAFHIEHSTHTHSNVSKVSLTHRPTTAPRQGFFLSNSKSSTFCSQCMKRATED
jgi:hypothetical protein